MALLWLGSWMIKTMPLEVITIEDDSDCRTCTRRHDDQFQLLREVRCKLLTGITCQECYRTIDVFVADDEITFEEDD